MAASSAPARHTILSPRVCVFAWRRPSCAAASYFLYFNQFKGERERAGPFIENGFCNDVY